MFGTGREGDGIVFKPNCTKAENTLFLWWERNEHCQEGDCEILAEVSCNNNTEVILRSSTSTM